MTPTYIHLESIRSTNTFLAQNAEGAVHGTVVYADCQTAGRGQRGNSWESADFKNITMSMLLRPANVKPSCQFWLSEAVALAVVHTLDRYIDNGVSIKWPNDIYWNDRKICGILVEHSLSGGKIDHTIAGIGLNINQEKFLSDAPNPVSLHQIISCDTPLPDVLPHLPEELLRLADLLPDTAEPLHEQPVDGVAVAVEKVLEGVVVPLEHPVDQLTVFGYDIVGYLHTRLSRRSSIAPSAAAHSGPSRS